MSVSNLRTGKCRNGNRTLPSTEESGSGETESGPACAKWKAPPYPLGRVIIAKPLESPDSPFTVLPLRQKQQQ